jgi:hypothetical protein
VLWVTGRSACLFDKLRVGFLRFGEISSDASL